jgi:hypothetical protein
MKTALALSLTLVSAFFTGVKAGDPSQLPNTAYKLFHGWDKGRALQHYTFNISNVGPNPVNVAPVAAIYKLVLNVNDDPHNTTQASIIDSIPGDPGYSDLWQIVKVVVPPGLPVVKSFEALAALQANKTVSFNPTEVYVNCPVVGAASTLENPSDAVYVTGYYQNYNVSWFDFGPNPNGNATAPLYHVLINNSTTELTDSVPGDASYTAFWNIFIVKPIAADLSTNYTSVTQISKDNVTFAGIVANCPITKFDASAVSTSSSSGSAKIMFPSLALSVAAMAFVSALL